MFVALLVLLAIATALWFVSMRIEDVSIVDLAWAPFFAIGAGVSYLVGPGGGLHAALLVALNVAWALRLSIYLGRRNLGHGEDRRYAAMRRKNPRFRTQSLVTVFGLQAVLAWAIGMPSILGAQHPSLPPGWLTIVGSAVFAVGFVVEWAADAQLARFKADGASRGRVMDQGLWRYSRHPNYFGNATLHVGLWLVALGAGAPAWTVICPAFMTFLLLRVSGVALLEKDIADRRPDYAAYIRRTSAFVPWPPRS